MWHVPGSGGSQPNGGFEKERAVSSLPICYSSGAGEGCSSAGVSHLVTPLPFSSVMGSRKQAGVLGPSSIHRALARRVGRPFLPDSPYALCWRSCSPAVHSQGSVSVRGRRWPKGIRQAVAVGKGSFLCCSKSNLRRLSFLANVAIVSPLAKGCTVVSPLGGNNADSSTTVGNRCSLILVESMQEALPA